MKGQLGFSLIEVLVALVILGVGVTILVAGFVQINDNYENINIKTYISNWSESKLNEIISGIDYNYHGNFEYRERRYRWWVEEDYLDNDLLKLILKVEWEEGNKIRQYSIYRYVINDN